MRARLALPIVMAAAVAVACRGDGAGAGPAPKGLASCGTATALFTASPIDPANIRGWVPLGNLNPPSHTFPTDHQYIYLPPATGTVPAVPLLAPGAMSVTGARRTNYSTGNVDYSVTFMPCAEVSGEFGHVTSIDASLLARLGPFDQNCQSYSPQPGLSVTNCYTKYTSVPVAAGEALGTARGLDVSLFDARIPDLAYANASRWTRNASRFDHFHVVAFTDYLAEPARSAIAPLIGSFDGKVRRTAAPIGGTIATDLPGTAQGTWIQPGSPTYPETPHLAIVPDNVDPAVIGVSMGASQPGMSSGLVVFPPSTGAWNHAPSTITPGPTIHCWEVGVGPTFFRRGVMLVQLVDATTLRVEARMGGTLTCDAQVPLAFTAAATTYVR